MNNVTSDMIDERRRQVESGEMNVPGLKQQRKPSNRRERNNNNESVVGVGGIARRAKERRRAAAVRAEQRIRSSRETKIEDKMEAMSSYDARMFQNSESVLKRSRMNRK